MQLPKNWGIISAIVTFAVTIIGGAITTYSWFNGLEKSQKQQIVNYSTQKAITQDKIADLEKDGQWNKEQIIKIYQILASENSCKF